MHVLLAYMPFQQMQCTSGELGGEVSDLLSPSSLSPWTISFARVMTFARAYRQPGHHRRYLLGSSEALEAMRVATIPVILNADRTL
jgi:hypothetical protein